MRKLLLVLLIFAVGNNAVYGPGNGGDSGPNIYCTLFGDVDDPFVKGKITGNDGLNYYDLTDQCKDAGTLIEYYCSASAKVSKEIKCDFGCGDGVCRKSLPSPSPTAGLATLDISSLPTGAEVYYSIGEEKGVYAGKTPVKLNIKPGVVDIRLKLSGYQEYSVTFQLSAGELRNAVVQLGLRPSPSVALSPTPPTTPGEYKCEFARLKERVKCRINLPDTEETRALPFVPEECRMKEGAEKGECISLYARLNVCIQEQTDFQREICAKWELQLQDVKQEQLQCESRSGNEKLNCQKELRQKVYSLIKFRFYNLEEKAEKLKDMGAREEPVVEFIADLELKKLAFNDASNLEQRKQVIWEVKKLWGDFKRQAISELNSMEKVKAGLK